MYYEDLVNLEEWLRRLKIEYHIFFSGNRKKPPDDLRLRVEKLIKKLSESTDLSLSQRFRFSTLITRFYVYRDFWRRTMLDREMGTESKGETTAAAPGPSPSAEIPIDAVRISISDPKIEEGKIQQLYSALLRIKKTGAQETSVPYEQFARYIAKQTLTLKEKHGCSRVAFTIALEEDAIRFTAAAEVP